MKDRLGSNVNPVNPAPLAFKKRRRSSFFFNMSGYPFRFSLVNCKLRACSAGSTVEFHLSLTPGFSPVFVGQMFRRTVFNGFTPGLGGYDTSDRETVETAFM